MEEQHTLPAEPTHRDAAREISRLVLVEIAPEEVEISLGFIDALIELAEDGEVVPVDVGDHVGGFGGADMMVVSVVPSVVKVLSRLAHRREGRELPKSAAVEEVVREAVPELEQVIRRVGSPRGRDRLPELIASISGATQRYVEEHKI